MKNGFILTSEESELLLHFEERGTIEKTAKALNEEGNKADHCVVSPRGEQLPFRLGR